MTTPSGFYKSNIDRYTLQLQSLKKTLFAVSMLRLFCFLLFAFFVYRLIQQTTSGMISGGIVSFLLFVVCIRISLSLNSRKKLITQLLFINKNERNVIGHQPNAFADGDAYSERAIHANDLDLFGAGSLFHLLNRTTTSYGFKMLAGLLNDTSMSKKEIVEQQEAVKRYAPQAELRQMIMAYGRLQDEEKGNISQITRWIETPNRLAGKSWVSVLRWLLPLWNIASLLFYLSADNPIPLGCGIIASWVFTGTYAKYVLSQHHLTARQQSVLEQYGSILKHFSLADDTGAVLLQRLKRTAHEAHRETLRLSRLTGMFDQRLNLLVSVFLNSFLIYDIQCMVALENWKQKNRSAFKSWLEAVGHIEVLNSLGAFAFNHPAYCFPGILEGKPLIRAEGLAHPLIPEEEQVANTIETGNSEQLLLVTGSNMSGKSTFLRTLGVNVLLARCGAPVCARKMECTPLIILSSIRISDSLQENTSYFMAELKRLHQIIETLETGVPALILIDEVLRGTNSEDKTHGSASLIKKLLQYNCLALFATHDLSLGELEQTYPGKISNYCFESIIQNGELSFDYMLRKGVAKNKNATFLMQKMGII